MIKKIQNSSDFMLGIKKVIFLTNWQILNGFIQLTTCDKIKYRHQNHGLNLRAKNQLKILKYTTDFFQESFGYDEVKTMNQFSYSIH